MSVNVADDSAAAVRVVIAEDELLIRQGLALVLADSEFQIIDQAGTADELLTILTEMFARQGGSEVGHTAADVSPLLVITDIRMPPTRTHEGLDAALSIRQRWPGVPICVLSQYVLPGPARRFLDAAGRTVPGSISRTGPADIAHDAATAGILSTGGIGYLLKQRITDIDSFLSSLRHIVSGGQLLDPEIVAELAARPGPVHAVAGLTERQREVLMLVAQGHTNAQIARLLQVTERAVVIHCSRIYDALGLPVEAEGHRRVHAVLAWLAHPAPSTG